MPEAVRPLETVQKLGEGLAVVDVPDLVALLLADKRSAATRLAYRSDLRGFFGGEPSSETLKVFLGQSAPQIALALRRSRGRCWSGVCLKQPSMDGRGLVDGEKARAYRDRRGTDIHTLRRLVALPGTSTLRGLRDTALLRLLCENALRRAEVCALDVADLGAEARTLHILGRGRGT